MGQFNFNLDLFPFTTNTDKKEAEAAAAFISALIFTLGFGLTLAVSLRGGEGKPGVAWWLRAEWKVS